MEKIKVKVKVKKQEPSKKISNATGYGFKPGYGENGRPLRDNYLKEQSELAAVGTKYEKFKGPSKLKTELKSKGQKMK